MSWTLAPSLKVLRDEINAAAPNRSKRSDGTIGDPAHAARVSDHNPNKAGVVRAFDVTHDPGNGVSCDWLADYLIGLFGVHPAMGPGSYVIWRARIWSYDKRSQGWRPSTGHHQHMHVSVATAPAGYNSNAPWGINGGDDMPSAHDVASEVWLIKHAELGGNARDYLASLPVAVWSVRHQALGGRTAYEALATIQGTVDGLVEAVKGIDGVDPAAVERAVHEGVASALASIETTVTVKGVDQ